MRLHFDIADMLVRFSLDDSDFAVVLTGIPTAVSYIQKLAVGIVSDPVGTEFQLDRIQQLESVTAEYAEHTVVSAGHEHFIERTNVRDTLRFLETGNAFQPFASPQIDHFQRAILEARHKEPLAFDIYVDVVNAALNVWHGNRLNKMQRFLVLGIHSRDRRN